MAFHLTVVSILNYVQIYIKQMLLFFWSMTLSLWIHLVWSCYVNPVKKLTVYLTMEGKTNRNDPKTGIKTIGPHCCF